MGNKKILKEKLTVLEMITKQKKWQNSQVMTARILKRRGGGGYYNADGVTLKVKTLETLHIWKYS